MKKEKNLIFFFTEINIGIDTKVINKAEIEEIIIVFIVGFITWVNPISSPKPIISQ